jgi:acetyl-CoA carboxylase biotin carboxyl carrier protein
MNLDFIARLIDLVERSKVSELELSEGENRVRIVKRANGTAALRGAPVTQAAPAPIAPRSDAASLAGSIRRHEIRAGFPGTFYRAPAPDQPPYAVVGASVEEGRQLAILEAMKTMNPVEADLAGIIREIAVDDATAVEAGTLLFVIEPNA